MAKSVGSEILIALDYIKNRGFDPDTDLVYDHCHSKDMAHFPNPDGYSVGMEDGMINS